MSSVNENDTINIIPIVEVFEVFSLNTVEI